MVSPFCVPVHRLPLTASWPCVAERSTPTSTGMLILNYFRRKDSASTGVFLPVPSGEGVLSTATVESANSCVGELASEPPSKRGKVTQQTYDPKTRAQIGKYAAHHGPQAVVRHFSKLRGHSIPESTTRKFRDAYLAELKKQSAAGSAGPVCVETLPTKPIPWYAPHTSFCTE